MAETMKLEIFRYRPEKENEPTFQTYEVPFLEDWVILDAINYIKDEIDGTLSYRWSCQMGVCGSCGMMINGVPKLSCAAFLKDYYPDKIRVEPLTGFPVERDLIFQMDDFMTKLTEIQPYIIRNKDEEKPLDEGEYLQTPAELALNHTQCVLTACFVMLLVLSMPSILLLLDPLPLLWARGTTWIPEIRVGTPGKNSSQVTKESGNAPLWESVVLFVQRTWIQPRQSSAQKSPALLTGLRMF